jgi:carbon catabolite-derepressing protein kinase
VAEYAEQEREAQEAVLDVRIHASFLLLEGGIDILSQPRNAVSPTALSPGGGDLEENPFEAEFNSEFDDDEDDLEDDGLDFIPLPTGVDDTNPEIPTFAVLNSSLPDQFPEQHHLTSYVSAKRSGAGGREKKQHKTKWHFGIRSRSPPMEVMLEIYRTLKALGMEWKEKKNLGGLGGVKKRGGVAGIERVRDLDGEGGVDLKAAAGVYFVETRARVQDVVVRGISPVHPVER